MRAHIFEFAVDTGVRPPSVILLSPITGEWVGAGERALRKWDELSPFITL